MKRFTYKILLELLKLLVIAKRFFVIVLQFAWAWLSRVFSIAARLLLFGMYKRYVALRRRLEGRFTNTEEKLYTVSGNTFFISILTGLIVLGLMVPHTQFWTPPAYGAVDTSILLAVVGPGEESEYDEEEIIVETSEIAEYDRSEADPYAYALRADQGPVGQDHDEGIEEIVGLYEGGSGIGAPIILPDAEVTPSRREITAYVVQQGDSAGSIAARFGISTGTLLAENNLTERSYIRPGDVLSILPVTGTSHVVKKGETISKIARDYDIDDPEQIVIFNRLANAADIVVGEKLVIPGGIRKKPVVLPKPKTSQIGRLPSTAKPVARGTVYAPAQYRNIAAPAPSKFAGSSGMVWPTSGHVVTQYYHARHHALDIDGHYDSPIYASDTGVVKVAGWRTGYGLSIDVDHGNGIITRYGHASKLFVSVGDRVTKGQVMAMVGTTGKSTGTHLHFEIMVRGTKVNPFRYVR